jgi:hypothetical protein
VEICSEYKKSQSPKSIKDSLSKTRTGGQQFHSLQKIGGQPNKNQHFRRIPKKAANREKFAAHKGQKLCNFAYKAELAANQI